MKKKLFKKHFLLSFFIISLLLIGKPLLASENIFPQDKYLQEENPFFLSKEEGAMPFPQNKGEYNNNSQLVFRLPGIGDDDNGLGEEEAPIGDSFFILIGFGVLYVVFRFKKQLMTMNFLHNKRIHFLILILAILPAYSFALDYYWVGGTGNWSDISHWATTSGGTVKYTLPPTAADNVYFDGGSGFTSGSKTVTLDQNSFCNNMTWQGFSVAPNFYGTIKTIEVNGSLLFSPGMIIYATNSIIFKSNLQGNTVTTGGVIMPGITFQGAGGWMLMDNLTCAAGYPITFTSGTLDLNGKDIYCANFSSNNTNARMLRLVGSTITCTAGWTYSGANSNVLTTAETANSLIKVIGNNGNNVTAKTGDRYNNVEFAVLTTGTITNGIYNKVLYSSGSGAISNIITDSLLLEGSFSFKFSNPSTVNKYFSAIPDNCGGMIDLTGGTVNMESGATTNVRNTRIATTTITGSGTPYPAVNSIDAGGNVGWNIQAMSVFNTYYWVGGTGNWSDINHWATTSGGTGGSGCLPTPFDNVIFDNNSGFTTPSRTVTLNAFAYCNDMSWLGTSVNPILTYVSASNRLEVHGSLYLQRGMTFSPYFLYLMSDTPHKQITSNGVTISNTVNFKSQNGPGGWDFQDSTRISSGANFFRGNLNFNGQYVSFGSTFSSPGNAGDYFSTRSLNIANSTIIAYAWDYSGGMSLAAAQSDNSLIRLTSSLFNAKVGDKYHYLECVSNSKLTNGVYDKITYLATAPGGTFAGTIVTDSLIFQNVGNFSFEVGITINKYFATKLSCGGVTNLSSNVSLERTITMGTPSEIHVSNAQISYISIAGPGVPYPAVNSTKVAGACAGWNFGAISSNTYYWVGGTGNWNDPVHWSLTSGLQNGSGCIPSPFDNVIFDNNSFSGPSQAVTLDGNAYCDSMSWIGNSTLKPVFNANYALQVRGSLLLQRGMTWKSPGNNQDLTMTSSRVNEKITSNGVTIASTMIINGAGGWIVADSLNCNGFFYFTNGNLNFNGQYAKMYGFNSANTTNPTRSINIANSIIDISNSGGWDYEGGMPLTADKSVNSIIRNTHSLGVQTTAKAGDIYYNVEYLNGALNTSAPITRGTYNKITISKMGSVLNAVTTDTLIYAVGGSTNTFTSGATSVINKLWMTNGTPCLPTTIQSTTAGSRANISMPATAANVLPNTVLFEFVRIRDLNAVTGSGRAKLKKGPQSIDDSGYGLSGNNSNWTMVPYVGASGFDGLGPDIARGCQDYPYTIELASAYYAGADGSYEWRKDSPTGTIIGTQTQLVVVAAGTYYMKVNYDLGKTCNLTDSKVVFSNADSLIWTGLAGNSDWNNSANWKKPNGTSDVTTVPRSCTDVLIPSGVSVYPNLNLLNTSRSFYNNAACRNIHFESGAETAYTDSLYYSKAFVDLTLQRDKWYMLSAPLQNMYSGDYWLAPFSVTAASGSAYNRNNPRVYMQQYQIQNPETGYYPGEASWSKSFNTLDVTLGIGQGYVVGIDQSGTQQTFHLPRPETQYEYFNKETGLPNGRWTPNLDRSNAFRMHIEPGFTGIIPVSWDSLSRSTLILGNPFMSHLSFSALRFDNPGLFGTTYYVWTGTSFDAFSTAGDQTTKTDWSSTTIDHIAPMQSFIVEKQNPGSLITSVKISSVMSVTDPNNNLRSHKDDTFGTLNISVYRDNVRQSAATLLISGGENVLTLFSGTVKEPAVIYFGTQDKPYSIFSSVLKDELEVGIRSTQKGMLSIRVEGLENLRDGSTVYLEDKLLGYSQNLVDKPIYTFNNETGNVQGRFFLKISNNPTGIDNLVSNSQISIYTIGNMVYLSSPVEPILRIEAFNTQGLPVYVNDNLNNNDYSFIVNSSNQLILIKVTTATNTKIKKLYIR